MHKLYYILLFIFIYSIESHSQGLSFNSSEYLIDERTSYKVFNESRPNFGSSLIIEFELSIRNPKSFGYILSASAENTDVFYTLVYVNSQSGPMFKLNLEGKNNLSSILLDSSKLGDKKWVNTSLEFNSKKGHIVLSIDGNKQLIGFDELSSEFVSSPDIVFGKNQKFIDVPDFAIRNLKFSGEKDSYVFNLEEYDGNIVHNKDGKEYGYVDKANWLIQDSYYWKYNLSKKYSEVTSLTYDPKSNNFFIINKDSLILYNTYQDNFQYLNSINTMPVPLRLGMSLVDTLNNSIYVYEVNDVEEGRVSFSEFNFESKNWEDISLNTLDQQRHHHNNWIDDSGNLMIFGGFGNQMLTNNIHQFNRENKLWELEEFTGDIISPRFFAGSVKKKNGDIILFGGAGNKDGDQSVGKTYFTDCYNLDLKNKKITKIWESNYEDVDMVSSRNMILSEDENYFYTIKYKEYNHETYLHLYKYSLATGDFEVMGDSIPMISERIRTNTNLYLNKETSELFCSIQEFQLDGSNEIKLYSLSFPPVNIVKKSENEVGISTWTYPIFFLVIIVLSFIFYKLVRNKRKRISRQLEILRPYVEESGDMEKRRPNSVYIFGDFTVIDKNNRDITYMFSPKIQQLFLLILFRSYNDVNEGVSSEEIYRLIWPNKTSASAKNLKNVSLSQLRKALSDLVGIEVIHNKGFFKLSYTSDFYCDFIEFNKAVLTSDNYNIFDINRYSSGGIMLKGVEFDNFRDEFDKYATLIVKKLTNYVKLNYEDSNYANTILACDILFRINPVNESALKYKIKAFISLKSATEAKKAYNNFILDFSNINGEFYSRTFLDIQNS